MGLLRVEVFRLSRLGLLRAAVVLLVAAAVLRGAVWPPVRGIPSNGVWSLVPVTAVVMIITAVTLGQEFSGGTFCALVTRGVARWHFLAARFVMLAALGGLLLVVTEGLATWLGARQALHAGELLRAWLSLWPYLAMAMLLTVVARNGGLALVVSVLQLALEQLHAMFMAPLTAIPEMIPEAFRALTHLGLSGTLYQWSLSYNSANWTYLADALRAPMPVNLLIYALPNPAIRSGLLLATYTVVGLGLSAFVLYRRDVTEVVGGKARLWGLISRRKRAAGARSARPTTTAHLPLGTGRGPLMVRLVRAHLFRLGRTALVRISAAVALLFPLTLWGAGALAKRIGYTDPLWSYGAGGAPPLVFALSLLAVGPLATVVGALAVSNELAFGTRRTELVRGAGRLHVIVAQSVALVLVLGAVLALMTGVELLIGAGFAGAWYLLPALSAVAAGMLAAGVYIAAVQVGGALTRAPAGALLLGLGFLVADWLMILAPAVSSDAGTVGDLSPYGAGMCALAAASWGRLEAIVYGWEPIDLAPALFLLAIYAILGHLIAVIVTHRRDA
ncbi:MAG: hypothetical protein JXA93_10570 [Anaerolineae bacterium]|nr:hypothetical protein [Anaerolineae bacterium]